MPTDNGSPMDLLFRFDPDYERNGKFYTIHLEDPELAGSPVPDNSHFPGLEFPATP